MEPRRLQPWNIPAIVVTEDVLNLLTSISERFGQLKNMYAIDVTCDVLKPVPNVTELRFLHPENMSFIVVTFEVVKFWSKTREVSLEQPLNIDSISVTLVVSNTLKSMLFRPEH